MYLKIILNGLNYIFKLENEEQANEIIKYIAEAENGTRVVKILYDKKTILLKTSKIISIEIINDFENINAEIIDLENSKRFYVNESIIW